MSNFGAGVGGGSIRGVEGQIMSHVFKPLVTRFVDSSKDLKTQENLVSVNIENALGLQLERILGSVL